MLSDSDGLATHALRGRVALLAKTRHKVERASFWVLAAPSARSSCSDRCQRISAPFVQGGAAFSHDNEVSHLRQTWRSVDTPRANRWHRTAVQVNVLFRQRGAQVVAGKLIREP